MAETVYGIVVIGRNEGERLQRCLRAAIRETSRVVYVDSNSTDDSVAFARSLAVHVVELDMTKPFSAARGRNEGFGKLVSLFPDTEFVQFIDGDCELVEGWLSFGMQFMLSTPDAGVVCGRRRERDPLRNTYHQLIDGEWDTPCGEVQACGGDALISRRAFEKVGGLNPLVIAGEEPEFCARVRQKGFRIYRLDHEMTLHDINMSRFAQWWKRSVRSGFGAADVSARLRDLRGDYFSKQIKSARFWAGFLPLLMLVIALFLALWNLKVCVIWIAVCLSVYALQIGRISLAMRRRGLAPMQSIFAGCLMMAAKPAELLGQVQYFRTKHKAPRSAIEYK